MRRSHGLRNRAHQNPVYALYWIMLDHFGSFWDIFRGSPSKESEPRSQHRGFLSCLLKIPGNIGGSLGIPWGDGALTDLEGDRASSDSLEVKACRPIKTVVLHSFMLLWCILMQFWIILGYFQGKPL